MEEWDGIERRRLRWFERWITPASIALLLALVVWLVQLNNWAVGNVADIGRLQGSVLKMQQVDTKQNEQLIRLTIILENFERRLVVVEEARE